MRHPSNMTREVRVLRRFRFALPCPLRSPRRRRAAAAGLVLASLSYLVLWVYVPSRFVAVGPGPAPDVATLVVPLDETLRDAAGPGSGRGRFLLTTIQARGAGPLELYRALTDPLVDIRPRWSVIPRGMSDEVYSRWGHAAMAESQAAAAWQAWLLLGSETGVVSDGGEVFFVSPDSPARGRLQAGDVVLSWSLGGTVRPFVLSDGFERGVRAAFHREGKAAAGLTLRLTREGEPMTVRFPVTAPDLTAWPFLGLALAAVNPRTDPPVPVSFLPGDIGGPSGGLMLSLQIVDDFTPGDLTGGRVVAGSGTIGPGGVVGAVGGVERKIVGAARGGAEVFLVPHEDYVEALQAAAAQGPEGPDVIPVGSLTEAYQALVSLTGAEAADYNGPDLPPSAAGPLLRVAGPR